MPEWFVYYEYSTIVVSGPPLKFLIKVFPNVKKVQKNVSMFTNSKACCKLLNFFHLGKFYF